MLARNNGSIGKSDLKFFEYMFSTYRKIMFYEINKIVFNTCEAEDILQNTFIKLSGKIDLLRELDEPRRMFYVVTTARNHAKNHVRDAQRTRAYSLDDDAFNFSDTLSDGTDVEQIIISKEQLHDLSSVWIQLDETSRRLLEGKYILNMDDAELAEMLGAKPASIRMMLTRARRRALKLMQEKDEAFPPLPQQHST